MVRENAFFIGYVAACVLSVLLLGYALIDAGAGDFLAVFTSY